MEPSTHGLKSVPLWLWMALLLVVWLGWSWMKASTGKDKSDDSDSSGQPDLLNEASEASLANGYNGASTAYPVYVDNADATINGASVPPMVTPGRSTSSAYGSPYYQTNSGQPADNNSSGWPTPVTYS